MTAMTCTWIERDDVFEAYVRDGLAPEERDAFEAHYFECAACADKVQACEALYAELCASPRNVSATSHVATRPWRWALVPVAAGIVLIAVVAFWQKRPPSGTPGSQVATAPASQVPATAPARKTPEPPAPATPRAEPQPKAVARAPLALSVLARVEPPLYIPVALRGPRDEGSEKFDAAMRRYVENDYEGALPDLRSAADLNPKSPQAAFFLAACELLTDRVEPSVGSFQRTIALGESPYIQEAHFYLAKARLRQGNLAAARQELRRAAERRGRLEVEARRLLAQVDVLSQQTARPPGR